MRQDQARVTLTVDGRDCGIFAKKEGGGTDSDDNKTFPGGMQPQVALGGMTTVDNLTLTKLRRLTDVSTEKFLLGRTGRGQAVATIQPLDGDGNAFGEPEVYTGVVKGVKPPEADANSNDPAWLEVEVSADGVA